ncbi:MAG: hypothetical protein JWR72_3717 [Flavisolibacter sp.]|jgi:hypothetical protein|nr:hypothetical protein [Flavisolibacter sp.]
MTAIISLVLLGICICLFIAHFAEIKTTHKKNGG